MYKQANTFSLYSNRKIGSKKLLDWLYKDEEVYIQRKYDRYIEMYSSVFYNKLISNR